MNHTIQDLQAQLEKALEALVLPSTPAELYDPLRYTLNNGGKRMRPLLVLMGNRIFDEDVSGAIHPALGIELFHNFTLLHDDIMDDAPLRRGEPTVHEKWNKNTAILSGDVTLVEAYQEMVQTKHEFIPQILPIFSKTAAQICEGQQLDMNYEERDDVTIDEYLKMIYKIIYSITIIIIIISVINTIFIMVVRGVIHKIRNAIIIIIYI